jgi:hypothetical protein
MVQTAIATNPERAYAGMIADASAKDVVTAVLQTSAGFTPGRFIVRDGTDEGECKAPTSLAHITSQLVLGVVCRDIAREPAAFEQYATLSILRKGRIWVTIEDAFEVGDEIWVRAVATGEELTGAVRTAQDSTDCVRVPGVILTAGDAGDLGMIEINFPYPQEVDEMQESVLDSGTFTPTGTNGTNTTAFANLVGFYQRVGSIVFATIRADVTHTAGAPTASTAEFSLPVASNMAAAGNLAGVVTGANASVGHCTANTIDDRVIANYTIGASGAQAISLTFSYSVI